MRLLLALSGIGVTALAYALSRIVGKRYRSPLTSPVFFRVWLLFGNELPPLHGLVEALLVLVNMEGPVLLEML
jgi:hypothetical protein